jgi:hypothetical protein
MTGLRCATGKRLAATGHRVAATRDVPAVASDVRGRFGRGQVARGLVAPRRRPQR